MTSRPPRIDCETHHASLLVPDVAAAAQYYTDSLGFTEGFLWGDPPMFGGVDIGKVRIFLRAGMPSTETSIVFFMVGNADELYDYHRANGVEIVTPPGDRAWGLHDYEIRDPWGNMLVFGHPIYNVGPPIDVERVDFPVRLEKRLAAVLADLAAWKGMTIDSCLEETLLHTFEPYGDGVANPHTERDLRHIQELKKKHGIDYDCHGSYRFVEQGNNQ